MSGKKSENFEQDLLPHLNSAYNLARWLTRKEEDAEDIVQEAYLRAFKAYHGFRGGDARPWLLRIVRNVYYTWVQQNPTGRVVEFDEDLVGVDPYFTNAEELAVQNSNGALLAKALEELPTRYREILTLRELEGMSYKEISTVLELPTGTVMSTLSRARARLRQSMIDLSEARPEAKEKK